MTSVVAPPLLRLMQGSVFVRAYSRMRFGKLEWVISHFRSWPRR